MVEALRVFGIVAQLHATGEMRLVAEATESLVQALTSLC
jgi:hypothetical protein